MYSQINCCLHKWCESLSSKCSTYTWISSEFLHLSIHQKVPATLNCCTG